MDNYSIKTLIQVGQLVMSDDAAGDKQIVVEIEDDQTLALVHKIGKHKMRSGKCTIVPISVNRILGYIFVQFSIMPELNLVYSSLFSYKDADLFAWPAEEPSLSETAFVSGFLNEHLKAIPLTIMKDEECDVFRG